MYNHTYSIKSIIFFLRLFVAVTGHAIFSIVLKYEQTKKMYLKNKINTMHKE